MSDVYLDHAATTPLRPEAVEAMTAALAAPAGNPSGAHGFARQARRRLDDARDRIASFVGAEPSDIVFTSGGTEADNLAIRGVAAATGGTVIASAVEHHAVLEPVHAVGGRTVPVDRSGRVDLDRLASELSADPSIRLVSVMLANNETGAINDLHAVADTIVRHRPEAVLHTDAVAAAPWLDLADAAAPADLVTVSAHKLGGPPGTGALAVRRRVALAAQMLGGGQEQERRSGTPGVAGAIAFAAAADVTASDRLERVARTEDLRLRLLTGLAPIDGLEVLSPTGPDHRTPATVQVVIAGIDRSALVFLLDQAGIAASWGSSCASGATEPSHVLAAMGIAPELAAGALRLSLGWTSTTADVDAVLAVLPDVVARLRTAAA